MSAWKLDLSQASTLSESSRHHTCTIPPCAVFALGTQSSRDQLWRADAARARVTSVGNCRVRFAVELAVPSTVRISRGAPICTIWPQGHPAGRRLPLLASGLAACLPRQCWHADGQTQWSLTLTEWLATSACGLGPWTGWSRVEGQEGIGRVGGGLWRRVVEEGWRRV